MRVCLDLCCGKGGATQSFRGKPGWHVVGVDNERKFRKFWEGDGVSFVLADVTVIDWDSFMMDVGIPHVDFLWASPPCTHFTFLTPKFPRKGIQNALACVGSCLEAIAVLEPTFWIMENPRARLRWFIGKGNLMIRYSDYDMKTPNQKATDLWGNLPLPMVKAIRRPYVGHRTWSWGSMSFPSRNSADRSMIPKGVSDAVYESVQLRLFEKPQQPHNEATQP